MPTVFTHVAVPVCAAMALGTRRVPVAALLAGMLASIVPDFDGLAFKLGIAYGGMGGHRGFTHTLLFALVLEVSPIALKRFFSPRGAQVLLNEMFTVWAPLLVAAVLALMARRTMERRHNGAVAA
jgi:inner membrane protein